MNPSFLSDLHTWHIGRGSDDKKWAQGILTRWVIALVSQKPPAVAKATGLLWQIRPASFLAYEKMTLRFKPCKKTLQSKLRSQRNLMTNMHAHCEIYFQESKFHTVDSKIIFSTVLHYSSNIPLLETNMKHSHVLWNIKKNLWTATENKNPNVLNFKPFSHLGPISAGFFLWNLFVKHSV